MRIPANHDVGLLKFKRGFSPTVELANGMVVVNSTLSTQFDGGFLEVTGKTVRVRLDDGQTVGYRHRIYCWHQERIDG